MSSFNGWTIISLPTSPPCPKSLEWQIMDVNGSNRSPFSLQVQIYDWMQAKLAASLSYQPMLPPQAAAWEAFLMNCRGIRNVFMVGDPLRLAPIAGGTGGSTTGTNASQSTTLATTGSGLVAGDWVQVGVRLYRVVDAPSGGSLPIWPPIRESIAPGTTVQVTNTQGLFRLTKNDRKYSVADTKVFGFSFECEEAL